MTLAPFPPRAADLDDPLPISAIQHAVYCLRQAALIHVERMWEENRFTAEGRVLHEQADTPSERRLRGVRRVTALPIACARLGIAGVADLVEFSAEGLPYPVEFKRGKPKPHRADEAQLCAQAFCLEEMTGHPIREAALFYAETKRRAAVVLDEDLRRLTEATVAALRETIAAGVTPPPTPHRSRCRACSLVDLCRPDAAGRSALAWRRGRVQAALGEAAP